MKNRTILMSLLLALAVLVVACGGDEDGDVEVDTDDDGVVDEILDVDYTVNGSGEVDFTLEPDNADYSYDWEEPATATGQDNMIESVNFGVYTMMFAGEDTEVRVIFSDSFEEGTHTVAGSIPESDVVDPDPIQVISATVAAGERDFIVVQMGTLTIDDLSNDLITGSFDFTLGDSDGDVSLTGEFQNLELPSIPVEALDNEEDLDPNDPEG